jgi:hypothetical protein
VPNGHPPCQKCRRRHRPGNCGAKGGLPPSRPAEVIQCHSVAGIVADLTRICGVLATVVEKLERVSRTREDNDGEDGH